MTDFDIFQGCFGDIDTLDQCRLYLRDSNPVSSTHLWLLTPKWTCVHVAPLPSPLSISSALPWMDKVPLMCTRVSMDGQQRRWSKCAQDATFIRRASTRATTTTWLGAARNTAGHSLEPGHTLLREIIHHKSAQICKTEQPSLGEHHHLAAAQHSCRQHLVTLCMLPALPQPYIPHSTYSGGRWGGTSRENVRCGPNLLTWTRHNLLI